MFFWAKQSDLTANELAVSDGTAQVVEQLHLPSDFSDGMKTVDTNLIGFCAVVTGDTAKIAFGEDAASTFASGREPTKHL